MKKTHFIPLILGLCLCLDPAPGPAQPASDRPMRHSRPGPRGPELFEALDLTETQQKQVKVIRREAAKNKARQEADIRIARLDLEALMDEDQPNRKKIHTQVEKIATLEAGMRILEIDQRLDIQESLTPEQLKKFKKMHMRRHHMRRHHMRRQPMRHQREPGHHPPE